MNRTEHLQWCKDRALEYVNAGDTSQAYASFASDMNKHSETKDHPALKLGMMMLMGGHLDGVEKMRKWINDFN